MRGKIYSYVIRTVAVAICRLRARIVPRLIDTHWLDGSIQTPTPISQLLNSASSSAVVDFRDSFTETEEGVGGKVQQKLLLFPGGE